MTSPMGVRNPDIVRERLKTLHDSNDMSFRAIAALDEFEPIPAGTLCSIYNGDPIPKKWRKRLGLGELVNVESVDGRAIPDGSQALMASFCKCGQPFISNHPRREKCFMCSPYRGRK